MTLATTYDQEWLKNYQDENGEYSNWNGMDPYNVNPYWDVYKNSNNSKKDQFRFNGKAIWNINKHLKLQGTIGAELNYFIFEDFKAPTTPGYEAGYLQNSNFRNRMYNFELLALYNNTWEISISMQHWEEMFTRSIIRLPSLLPRICRFVM